MKATIQIKMVKMANIMYNLTTMKKRERKIKMKAVYAPKEL